MEDVDDPVESLTPYPEPEYTEAPTPIPSSKVPLDPNGLTQSAELVKESDAPAEDEYDGPEKTGKTLKDLALDLGAPESLGALIDDMQEAIIGIVGDLVNNKGERTSIADILGHENRLRGIGALCVLAALIGLTFDSIAGESLRVLPKLAE
jgi:hypothetical protein